MERDNVRRRRHRIVEPVIPSQSKAQCIVDETTCVRAERARHGDERGHFAQAEHRHEDNRTDDRVGDQGRRRTTRRQGPAGAQKETCTDRAAYGNHLYLTCRKPPGESVRADVARLVAIVGFAWDVQNALGRLSLRVLDVKVGRHGH